MKRMSSDPADWGISVFTVSREQARKLLGIPEPKPTGPPPWQIDDRGYIGLRRAHTFEEMGRAERQLQQESPIFVQAVSWHNRDNQNRERLTRFKHHNRQQRWLA